MVMIKIREKRFRDGHRCDDLFSRRGLDKALERFISHLMWKDVQLVAHNVNTLMIRSTGMGTVDTTTFEGSLMDMRHLHQLAHVVFGLHTDIPTHRVFRDTELWDKIEAVRGPVERAKAILACSMGGVPQDVARSLVARDYKTEEVCMAYALHVEDPSVPMLDLLSWNHEEA